VARALIDPEEEGHSMRADHMDAGAEVNALVTRLSVTRQGTDRFEGRTCDVGSPHVYGGQYLGQALMAAGFTCDGRPPHSLHAVFLHLGDKSRPVTYEVRRQHDGASFSRRHVTASQGARSLFEAQVSFQQSEGGVQHQEAMPGVPAPETLVSERSLRAGFQATLPDALRERLPNLWPIDVRPLAPLDPLEPEARAPHARWWIRVNARLADDPLLHAALLAYASDFAFLQAALLPHRFNFLQPSLRIASLDHAMWFLRDLRVDEWLLFDTTSPSVGGARCLARGNVFTETGKLVASVAQEGFMRQSSHTC
jgi:acyl-CoA thioesterase-2